MKKTKGLILFAVCIAIVTTCSVAIETVLYDADITMSASYSKERSMENKLTLNVLLDEKNDKEISVNAKLYEDKELTRQINTTSTALNNKSITYNAITVNRLSEIYVKPPVLLSTSACQKIVINLQDVYEQNDIFKVNGFEKITKQVNDEMRDFVVVNIEAVGNGNVYPRFPKLKIDNAEVFGVTSLNFDDDGFFVNGFFVFDVTEFGNSNTLEIIVEDCLVREDAPIERIVIQ